MSPLVVLVDDRRTFQDKRVHAVVRTSQDAIRLLWEIHSLDIEIDELWLDHDLGLESESDIGAVLEVLEQTAANSDPLKVKQIFAHSANPYGREMMVRCLAARGYSVVEWVDGDFHTFIDKDFL